MSQQATYYKVRVEPKTEARMIGVLMESGQPFKAVSRNEYYITKKQSASLTRKKIPYQKM